MRVVLGYGRALIIIGSEEHIHFEETVGLQRTYCFRHEFVRHKHGTVSKFERLEGSALVQIYRKLVEVVDSQPSDSDLKKFVYSRVRVPDSRYGGQRGESPEWVSSRSGLIHLLQLN